MKNRKIYCWRKHCYLGGIMMLFVLFADAQTFVQIKENTHTRIKLDNQLKAITLFKGEIYAMLNADSILFGTLGQVALPKGKFTTLSDSLSKSFTQDLSLWRMTSKDDLIHFDCSSMKTELGVFNTFSIRVAFFSNIKKDSISKKSLEGYFRVIPSGYPSWVGRIGDVRQEGLSAFIPTIEETDSSKGEQPKPNMNEEPSSQSNNSDYTNSSFLLIQLAFFVCLLFVSFFIAWLIVRNRHGQNISFQHFFEQQSKFSQQLQQLTEIVDASLSRKEEPIPTFFKEEEQPKTKTVFTTTVYADKLSNYLSYLEENVKQCFALLHDSDQLDSEGIEAVKLRQILSKYTQSIQSNSTLWRRVTEAYACYNTVLDIGLHKEIVSLQIEEDKIAWVNKQIRRNYLDEVISQVFILLEEVRSLINLLPASSKVNRKFCTQLKSDYQSLIDKLQEKTQFFLGFRVNYVPLGVKKDLYAKFIEASDYKGQNPLFEEMVGRASSEKDLFIIEIIQYTMSDSSDYTKIKVA